MSYFDANCTLIKKNYQIIGISLIAQPNTKAEEFCKTFARGLLNRDSKFVLIPGKIIFSNLTSGCYSFQIEKEDSICVRALLCGWNGEIGIYKDGILVRGFKILKKTMRDCNVEETQLTPIILH